MLLRWPIERDFLVLIRTTNVDRVSQNSRVFDFSLSQDDIATMVSESNQFACRISDFNGFVHAVRVS